MLKDKGTSYQMQNTGKMDDCEVFVSLSEQSADSQQSSILPSYKDACPAASGLRRSR